MCHIKVCVSSEKNTDKKVAQTTEGTRISTYTVQNATSLEHNIPDTNNFFTKDSKYSELVHIQLDLQENKDENTDCDSNSYLSANESYFSVDEETMLDYYFRT